MVTKHEEQLSVFARKVMRKILSPIKNPYGSWRISTNEEIDLLIKLADTVGCIKAQRIRWIGHIARMDKERTV
jgi:hypothetical protein